MRIILKPDIDQFKEVEHWLIEELQTTKQGSIIIGILLRITLARSRSLFLKRTINRLALLVGVPLGSFM